MFTAPISERRPAAPCARFRRIVPRWGVLRGRSSPRRIDLRTSTGLTVRRVICSSRSAPSGARILTCYSSSRVPTVFSDRHVPGAGVPVVAARAIEAGGAIGPVDRHRAASHDAVRPIPRARSAIRSVRGARGARLTPSGTKLSTRRSVFSRTSSTRSRPRRSIDSCSPCSFVERRRETISSRRSSRSSRSRERRRFSRSSSRSIRRARPIATRWRSPSRATTIVCRFERRRTSRMRKRGWSAPSRFSRGSSTSIREC